ncbi:MAG TPA: glycosyltransferase family 87 protein [Verrucomicrobiae bacterium]
MTTPAAEKVRRWSFTPRERTWLAVALFLVLAFGANVEQRTALRRVPMTDLGVFATAAEAVRSGDNLYTVSDWHGWHYVYPPALAILFVPFSQAAPAAIVEKPGTPRTVANTPWGYDLDRPHRFFGLHRENARFFFIVAAWYFINIAMICLSAHALACALEGNSLKEPPHVDAAERRRWWILRAIPLVVIAGSLGTDLSRGQTDILMLAAMSFGLYLTAIGQAFKAGLWLSGPAVVKLFPALLLIYPLWRRQWRMAAGAGTGLVLMLVALPVLTMGPSRSAALYKDWVQILVKPALGKGSDKSLIHELTGMQSTDNQSLLAFIHNWRYHNQIREQRPAIAAPAERFIVYAVGALLLAGLICALGSRRNDSPRDLLIIAGLLVGVALIINPVAHNYYYLLLLPLVVSLLHRALENKNNRTILTALAIFTLTDLAARLPRIGPLLRDDGLPLVSLLILLSLGVVVLLRRDCPDDKELIVIPVIAEYAK